MLSALHLVFQLSRSGTPTTVTIRPLKVRYVLTESRRPHYRKRATVPITGRLRRHRTISSRPENSTRGDHTFKSRARYYVFNPVHVQPARPMTKVPIAST